MALFGKKKPSIDTVPQEVRDYYQSERRERTGVAWLLALGTLVVTLMLALGLWFGGKWVYQTLTNRDEGTSTTGSTQLAQNDDNTKKAPDDTKKDDSKKEGGTVSDGPAVTNTPSTPASSGTQQSGSATTPATNNTRGTAAAGTTATNNAADESADRLVNTGPAETLYVFVIAFVGGVLGYRVWLRHIA